MEPMKIVGKKSPLSDLAMNAINFVHSKNLQTGNSIQRGSLLVSYKWAPVRKNRLLVSYA